MKVDIVVANYANIEHANDIVFLLNNYAMDEMGGGQALPDKVKQNVVSCLANIPYAFTLLAYVDDVPAGIINCFEAFSTFTCQPLINIHDLAVEPKYRRLGISQQLLAKVEVIAAEKGCSKVTLEVLEGNGAARESYMKFGFEGYELDPNMGKALFWQKTL